MKKMKTYLFGIFAGFLNSIFGVGGGLILIPYLKSRGLSQKEAQASSLPVILPLTAISALLYVYKGYTEISEGLKFIPFGLIGAICGVYIIDKISDKLLNMLFSVFLLYSGFRILF